MKKKVRLTIQGEQNYEGAGKDTTRQQPNGTMEETEQGVTLCYEEHGEDGARTETTLTLTEGRAVLRRTGAVRSKMIFEQGRKHTSLYELAFGALPVTVEAERVAWRRTAHGLMAELRYQIDLAGQRGVCTLRVRAQTEDENGVT